MLRKDKRSPLLNQQQLEEGKTHDDLWNAAQLQLVTTGKMHGFLRYATFPIFLERTPFVAIAVFQ